MVTTTLRPEIYRGFIINELLRDFIFTDALNRGGFVYAKKLHGDEGIAALADKLNRELVEAADEVATGNMESLATEVGDVLDVADLTTRQLGKTSRPVGRPPLALVQDKLAFLHGFAEQSLLPEGLAAHFLRKVVEEVRGAVSQTYINAGQALGRHVVEEARKAKNAAKGRHNGWYGLHIILPRNDEWCSVFAAKYREEHDLSQFDIDRSLTHDHFAITRSSG